MKAYISIFKTDEHNGNIQNSKFTIRRNYRAFNIGRIYAIHDETFAFRTCIERELNQVDITFFYQVEVLKINKLFREMTTVRWASKIKIISKA